MAKDNNKAVINCLNQIFQAEMGGIMRYLHYSFMIMGHNRIPIQKWFREQAQETQAHAVLVGEWITSLGGHPSQVSASVKETKGHDVDVILKESLQYEEATLELYKELAHLAAENNDIALDEFARGLILDETNHIHEVKKMLRKKS